ncbi:MAG TPA: hypothetical protein VEW69_04790 [Alphaproteobacteria bacterium]|nr:hypothetical protein [Alphaproteobacteria bacterium]
MRKIFPIFLACFLLSLGAAAQNKRGPSTPEERKRFLSLVQQLEKNPLDETLRPEVKWAFQWLDAVPDITVDICPTPLEGLPAENYKYTPQLFGLYVFAMGRFAIEHPDKAGDKDAVFLAGVETALKGYQEIVKDKSNARSTALDTLLQKQKDGKLKESVQNASKACAGS